MSAVQGSPLVQIAQGGYTLHTILSVALPTKNRSKETVKEVFTSQMQIEAEGPRSAD